MGLFDNIGGMIAGAAEGQGGGSLGALGGLLGNHPEGLPGMVSAFQQAGLGGVVNSWISNEANQGITGDQVRSVLGDGPITQYAEKVGITPDMAAQEISQLLPQVVNHLTPNGTVPEGGAQDALSGLLSNFKL